MMTKYEKWKTIQYYALIGVISLIALFFLPMIGSEAGLEWNLPTTTVGWIVYIVSKLLVATINILIFHCFVQQGKVNIRNNPKFLEANEILVNVKLKEDCPRSPAEYNHTIYGKKSVAIFVTTLLSAIGLTQAVLTFDWISMLTYFFTILMGLVFGIIQMNDTEQYWTEEYWRYAKKIEKLMAEEQKRAEEAAKEVPVQGNVPSNSNSGSDILDTGVVDCNPSVLEPVVVNSNECSDSVLVHASDTSSDTTIIANWCGEEAIDQNELPSELQDCPERN